MTNPRLVPRKILPIDKHSDSLFIACTSYEERTTLATRRLSSRYRTEHSVICRAAKYEDKGNASDYFEEVNRGVKKASAEKPTEITFEIDQPVAFIERMAEVLSARDPANTLKNVTVDITTFPRQELLILLRYLDNHSNRGNIRLLYGEPKRYATEERRKKDRWLTRGVQSVHSVPGFSGIQYPQLAKLLVVILGHEGERTYITLRRHQPDKVIFLGQSDEQFHVGLKEIAEKENENMTGRFGPGCFWRHRLPAHSVSETKRELERIFQSHRFTHNLFIAPNGTKLQLIGTYLAVRRYMELQITYATPAVYNWERYSTGSSRLWEVTLNPVNVKP